MSLSRRERGLEVMWGLHCTARVPGEEHPVKEPTPTRAARNKEGRPPTPAGMHYWDSHPGDPWESRHGIARLGTPSAPSSDARLGTVVPHGRLARAGTVAKGAESACCSPHVPGLSGGDGRRVHPADTGRRGLRARGLGRSGGPGRLSLARGRRPSAPGRAPRVFAGT